MSPNREMFESKRNRNTCKLLQLRDLEWSRPSDLNRRPFDYESNALPTELGRLNGGNSRRIGTKAEFQNILFRIGLCQGSGSGERTPPPPSDNKFKLTKIPRSHIASWFQLETKKSQSRVVPCKSKLFFSIN